MNRIVTFVIGSLLFWLTPQVNIGGIYTQNLTSVNQLVKLAGNSGGGGTPILTGSALIDSGTTLAYSGTSMTINAAPVMTGLGQGDLKATLTTTAAASDIVPITGVSATSNCTFSAANASAATNIATSFVSAVAANQVTLSHAATASMIYNIQCTPV